MDKTISRIIENICNPKNEPNGLERCSIACMDADYNTRLNIYPDTVDFDKCPSYWKGHKVHIELVDYNDLILTVDTDGFMTGITIYAFVMGMGYKYTHTLLM